MMDATLGMRAGDTDGVLLTRHAAGALPNTISFSRFRPTVAIGRHQVMRREARLAYCTAQGIGLVRRASAGGALYLDEGIQCMTIVVPTEVLGPTLAGRLEQAAGVLAAALSEFGVKTHFKAPNDLETHARQKIASVFLAEQGSSTQIFATLIVKLNLKSAMQALLVPTEKLTVTGLEHAKERMTSLADEMGFDPGEARLTAVLHRVAENHFGRLTKGPGLSLRPAGENAGWDEALLSFETKDKTAGATLRLRLVVSEQGIVTAARFATDAHLRPATVPRGLGEALAGVPLHDAADRCARFLAEELEDAAGVAAPDVVRLVERAGAKWKMQREAGFTAEQTSGLMLAGGGPDIDKALANASVMLVPYCAKPNWCKWRHTIDCVECGECEVGDAYAMARERNMEVVTITNFEHLSATLEKMKAADVESYVGMCCGEFFLKRHHAFRDSGMDAVLLDIEGATCYELKEEHLAYAGAFKAEARLDLEAVRKLMAKVPVREAGAKPCLTGQTRRPGEKRCGSCGTAAPPP